MQEVELDVLARTIWAEPRGEGVAAGSCRISVRNLSAGSLSEAIVLSFVITKGATA